jgi:hypothetical protein
VARRLTKTARELAAAAGVDPENLAAFLREEAELAADIVKLKMQDIIDVDLVGGSDIQSLQGYKVLMIENFFGTRVEIGGEIFNIPSYSLSVEPSPPHAGLEKPINIFEILDKGREELPYRGPKHPYVLWSNTTGRNVPTTNQRVRGRGGRFVTQFRASPQHGGTTPARREPRQGPGREPAVPRDELNALARAGVRFFHPGPLPAVPPRNLYKRMLKSIQGEIKRRGDLPIEVEIDGE